MYTFGSDESGMPSGALFCFFRLLTAPSVFVETGQRRKIELGSAVPGELTYSCLPSFSRILGTVRR